MTLRLVPDLTNTYRKLPPHRTTLQESSDQAHLKLLFHIKPAPVTYCTNKNISKVIGSPNAAISIPIASP